MLRTTARHATEEDSTDAEPRSLAWITRLVRLDTTSRGSNLELIDVVATELRRLGLTPTILPNEEGTEANLVATIPAHDGGTDGGIALSGHTDVVPVDGQDWHTDPFAPQVRDGRLYGRGTCDMKGFLGVVLAALPDLVAARLREPVHLLLSYDEEVGCGGGAALARDLAGLGIHPRICFVGEPSSMRVTTAHKSITPMELTVHGVAAHSSLTPHGVNAIEYASRAIVFIRCPRAPWNHGGGAFRSCSACSSARWACTSGRRSTRPREFAAAQTIRSPVLTTFTVTSSGC